MNVYILKKHYDYEGFEIEGVYASEERAEQRMQELEEHSRLPMGHINHEFSGDRLSVDCYEVDLL